MQVSLLSICLIVAGAVVLEYLIKVHIVTVKQHVDKPALVQPYLIKLCKNSIDFGVIFTSLTTVS